MKKLLSAFLSAAMILVPFSVFGADAETTELRLSAGTVSAEPGTKVIVPIELTANPGIISLSFTVTYDTTALELEDAVDCKLFASASFTPSGDISAVPFRLVWDDALAKDNDTETGTLANLYFNVLDTAEGGLSEIRINVEQENTFNFDFDDVQATASSGGIEIIRAAETTTTIAATTTESTTTSTTTAATTTESTTTTTTTAATTTKATTTTTTTATTTESTTTTTTTAATTTKATTTTITTAATTTESTTTTTTTTATTTKATTTTTTTATTTKATTTTTTTATTTKATTTTTTAATTTESTTTSTTTAAATTKAATTTTTAATTTKATTTTEQETTTTDTTTDVLTTTAAEAAVTTTTASEASGKIASDETLCQWAIVDYKGKTDVEAAAALITKKTDESYSITLRDENGKILDVYTIDPATGIGTDSANQEVNLPQTGNNDIAGRVLAVSALCMMLLGLIAVGASGILRRREKQ